MEPKHINDVMEDKNWVKAMQEELEQFQKNDIWKLVELPQGKKAMGAKWVFRNKLDAAGKVVRNKGRLVEKGYSQQEGIDYTKTFIDIGCLEAICILISFASHTKMRLYQMDIKRTYLNGVIQEVYVEQPPGFKSNTFPHHVFKLYKALYGLKQAPRAWYECLSSFLLNNSFERGKMDATLFQKNYDSQFILV